ncbi:hypothetical protein ACFQ4L_08170 [Lapidilactobacillus mulanensis]|uniref:Uncharacterized protein n=1 Tax=Lapidilactobacillus mulanensis TaxID=2485999 RepID=A0ABW4DMY7_9LACO
MNNLEKSKQESTKRGCAFTNALSIETLDQALAAEIYIPVLLVLNHNEVTTTRYGAGPQESILTMQLTPNALVFSSLGKNIAVSRKQLPGLKIIKSTSPYSSAPLQRCGSPKLRFICCSEDQLHYS